MTAPKRFKQNTTKATEIKRNGTEAIGIDQDGIAKSIDIEVLMNDAQNSTFTPAVGSGITSVKVVDAVNEVGVDVESLLANANMTLPNLIINGNLFADTTGWNGSLVISSALYVSSPYSLHQSNKSQYEIQDISANSGDVLYISVWGYQADYDTFPILVAFDGSSFSNAVSKTGIESGSWEKISLLKTATADGVRVMLGHFAEDLTVNLFYDDVVAVNLTSVFGTGNEPTATEMDEILAITGWFDGSYTLTQKQIMIFLLNRIRANRTAIVSLGGTF